MGEFFRQTTQQLTPIGFDYDDNGKVWLHAVAHAALTADSPYKVVPGQNGYVTQAIASGTTEVCFVGFAAKAWATADIARLQIGGEIDDVTLTTGTTYTAGDYVTLVAGAFTQATSDNVAGQFAVVTETATGAGDPNLMLSQIAPILITS